MRNIFTAIAADEGDRSANGLLSLSEWLEFLDALGFIAKDVTHRDAILCFIWSRMAVIDASTKKGKDRECMLPYEGFLEAVCRLAMIKALPFDHEIAVAGFNDAGAYINHIKLNDEDTYDKMIEERSTKWGEEPPQPKSRQLEHTITTMIRQIEEESAGADNLQITAKEAADWAARAMGDAK